MKAHLKTIGIILAALALIYVGVMFPKAAITFLMLVSLAALYYLVWSIFREEDDDELSGPFNAGGRERD
jgi:inner membrane protein involved in colicin E2 resistance